MTTPPKSKIYTRAGDQGKTRLVGGECVDKFNPRVEAYGTTDELNSYLGVVRSLLVEFPSLLNLDTTLESIQNELFNLGSQLACESAELAEKLPLIGDEAVAFLERKIDLMDAELPPLNQFVLPAGHSVAAHLHFARTICRRSERRTAELQHLDPRFQRELIYLNRLSDLLFVAARWANSKMKITDAFWQKGSNTKS